MSDIISDDPTSLPAPSPDRPAPKLYHLAPDPDIQFGRNLDCEFQGVCGVWITPSSVPYGTSKRRGVYGRDWYLCADCLQITYGY